MSWRQAWLGGRSTSIHFLVPCGTTGEADADRTSERGSCSCAWKKREASAVLAGAGGYDTERSFRAPDGRGRREWPAVSHAYNKPTPSLFSTTGHRRRHQTSYRRYNVPGHAGCNVDVPTLVRPAIPNVVGVKKRRATFSRCAGVPRGTVRFHRARATAHRAAVDGGRRRGVISVASNECRLMSQMVKRPRAAIRRGQEDSCRCCRSCS